MYDTQLLSIYRLYKTFIHPEKKDLFVIHDILLVNKITGYVNISEIKLCHSMIIPLQIIK